MSKVIHRDELDAMREATDQSYDAPMATVMRLLDHIDAMREHSCFYKWSAVKAAKAAGGPPPNCIHCGEPSPSDYQHRTQAELAERLGRELVDPAVAEYRRTIADGTRGMERGR